MSAAAATAETHVNPPIRRCQWVSNGDAIDVDYHDREWGVPVRNDRLLFEFLTLEGAQAGLSWATILRKREGYRRAFANFDVARVARLNSRSVERLMKDASIVRNRLKIESTISNAKAFLRLREREASFAAYLWRFVDDAPIQQQVRSYVGDASRDRALRHPE